MKLSQYILSSLVIVSLLITALIPIRVASIAPFKLSTTAIAQQEQNPMQLMMLIMMMQHMNQNNELQGAQRERANDATENLLTQLNGLGANQLNNQLPNPATP